MPFVARTDGVGVSTMVGVVLLDMLHISDFIKICRIQHLRMMKRRLVFCDIGLTFMVTTEKSLLNLC